jgi:hypothetical protein
MTSDTNQPNNAVFIYTSTVALSIMIVIGIIVIYMFQQFIGSYFMTVIWGAVPLLTLIIGMSINMIGQKITCNAVNPANAIKGALPVVGLLYAGLGLGQISYFRAPVASLFAQIPNVSVLNVEAKYPYIKGAGVAYWAFWSVMLGQVIGSGMATIC